MKVVYYCEKCEHPFNNKDACLQHELQCVKNYPEEKAKALVEAQNSRDFLYMCNHCNHAYYVYGCELDCKYNRSCNRRDGYPFWEKRQEK